MGVWQVRLHPEGQWQVLTPGSTQACARTETQVEAIAAAYRLAGDEGGGQLIVHTAGGVIDSYQRVAPNLNPYRRNVS